MATTLTLREVKGSPLTFGEMDSNLTSIDGNKQEIIPNLTLDTVIQANLDKFSFYDSATSTTRAILAENNSYLIPYPSVRKRQENISKVYIS